jgi:hypothetical protein
MRGNAGDWAVCGFVIAVLASCGGRSTHADGSGGGGSQSSNTTGASIGARGGFGGGPSKQIIADGCIAICDKAERSACRGFDHGDCSEGCTLNAPMVSDTAACATVAIEHIYCIDDLPDVCAVLADDPVSTRCDQGAFDVGACIQAYCESVPVPIECRIAH